MSIIIIIIIIFISGHTAHIKRDKQITTDGRKEIEWQKRNKRTRIQKKETQITHTQDLRINTRTTQHVPHKIYQQLEPKN